MAGLAKDLERRRHEEAQQIRHAIIQSILHTVGNEAGNTQLAADLLTEVLETNGPLNGEQQVNLDRIKSSASRLGQIMSELRQLDEEASQPVRAQLIKAIRIVTRLIERDHYYTIDISHEVDPALMVQVSEYLFREAFGNLVRNAVHAMIDADGGGDLRISAKRMEREWNDPRQATVCIDIEDSGPGICPVYRKQIWDYGFTTRGEGHGYGLFYTRGLVTMLGGSVQLMNEPSDLGGAHFRMTLPMATAAD